MSPSFGVAVFAAYKIVQAATSPLWGRISDGVPMGMLLSVVCFSYGAVSIGLAVLPLGAEGLLVGAAILGSVTLPFTAVMRVFWNRVSLRRRASAGRQRVRVVDVGGCAPRRSGRGRCNGPVGAAVGDSSGSRGRCNRCRRRALLHEAGAPGRPRRWCLRASRGGRVLRSTLAVRVAAADLGIARRVLLRSRRSVRRLRRWPDGYRAVCRAVGPGQFRGTGLPPPRCGRPIGITSRAVRIARGDCPCFRRL